MSSTNPIVNTDPFGLWMMKPTKQGGQVWYIYNTDFNDDPQVYTESSSMEYLVHNVQDADGTRFTISASDTFKTYISTSTGYNASQNITDQQQMAQRGYMQNPQDWRNVELTGQFVVFKEPTTDDFITFGFRGGKHTGTGAPAGCNASTYLVEVNMKAGGLIRVRKKSWNNSIHNWLSTLASGFVSTKVCGWSIKILVYNSQDGNSVNVEVWLDADNDNRYDKVLSGTDTGQINTDANVCNCTAPGQPLTWGGPFVLMQGNTGTFGFKNMSIREIEGFGTTLPPVDPGTGGGTGGGTGNPPPTGGGGGSGSGTGGGGTGGGGGTQVDLTPVLATPKTSFVQYGGGPNISPLEFHFIFAGAAWNQAPSTTPGTPVTQTTNPIFPAPLSSATTYNGGLVFVKAIVHFIFWGSQWNTKTTPWSKTSIMAAMDKVFKSSYFDGLMQYGYPSGAFAGAFLCFRPKIGSIAINTTYAPSDNFDQIDIRNVIIDSINRGLVPDGGLPQDLPPSQVSNPSTLPQHIYYVIGSHNMFPAASYADASSFHYILDYDDLDKVYVYAFTDDMDFVNGNSTNLSFMTYGMTHEIVEAITDPFIAGWYQGTPNPTSGDTGEIADVCGSGVVVDGVSCCPYFSNQDNSCIAPSTKPLWIQCPSGYTYDSTTQTCTKTTTTSGTTNTGTTANTTLKTQTQNAITAIFNSNYFTGLYQYGLTKKPIIGSFVVNTTAPAIPNKYTNTQISALIDDSITKSLVPANTATGKKNIAYLVILPPDHVDEFNGWGEHYVRQFFPPGQPTNTYYYFIGTSTYVNNFNEFTKTISHELIEMVSDNITTDPAKGYTIKTGTAIDPMVTKYGPELADVCEEDNTNATITGGIQVAKYWSDQDGKCIIPPSSSNPTPWASCHTGAVFDNATQSCKLQPTPGGGGTTPPGTGAGQGYKVVLANATDDDGNVPANAVDGKLDTRWSAFGKGQFLRLDLGTPKKVNKIKIAWYQGDKRSNHFEIWTAANTGDSFISRFKGDSTQGSTALQDYPITETTCRYIRIVGQGNTQNDWISISETEVWGPDVANTTPGTGTGGDPGSGGTTQGGDTGGGTGTPAPDPTPVPEHVTAYNFFDTSFSIDYKKIGLCNPAE